MDSGNHEAFGACHEPGSLAANAAHRICMTTYYGAVADYGTDIDIFICKVRVHEDEEVSIDLKRIGKTSPARGQRVPEHNRQMTPEEEILAVGATSIPKKRITNSVEAEIERLLRAALQISSAEVKKLRETDLASLF